PSGLVFIHRAYLIYIKISVINQLWVLRLKSFASPKKACILVLVVVMLLQELPARIVCQHHTYLKVCLGLLWKVSAKCRRRLNMKERKSWAWETPFLCAMPKQESYVNVFRSCIVFPKEKS